MANTNILVVEDESIVAEDIRLSLEGLGYNVVDVVGTGEEAIKNIEEYKSDLVLMDIVLKGAIDGIETATQIRSRFNIPVVYLTAYADKKTLDKAKVSEPYGYILKPFNDLELHSTIETAIYMHKIRQKLRESEERFRSVVEYSLEGILIVNNKYQFVYVNDELTKILGYSRDEILGKDFREFLDEESRSLVSDYYIRRQRGENVPNRYSFNIIRKDGDKRCVEMSAITIKDSGANIRSMGQILDVTERKRAENIQFVLYQIANAVNTAKDVNELFKTIRNLLSRVLNTKNFFIALYDEEKDMISLPYHVDEKDKFDTFPAGKTLTAYLIRNDKSLLLDEKDIDKLVKRGLVEIIGKLSKIWLGVPLRIKGKVTGAVVVQSYTDASLYTQNDLELLEFVSDQIALAIERKGAEEELKRRLDELEIYYKASVGREKRVIELKQEVNQLLAQLRRENKYGA